MRFRMKVTEKPKGKDMCPGKTVLALTTQQALLHFCSASSQLIETLGPALGNGNPGIVNDARTDAPAPSVRSGIPDPLATGPVSCGCGPTIKQRFCPGIALRRSLASQ